VGIRIINRDCRDAMREMPAESVQTCVTSPPYFGLRDYGVAGQIGLEPTPDDFVAAMVEVFREVKRVLRKDGTLWLNLGDSYASNPGSGYANGNVGSGLGKGASAQDRMAKGAGSFTAPRRTAGLKPKDLIGIPWRVAFALQADGWWLRSSIIWHKPNPMPESVQDRPTSAHENIFLFAKSERYFYDHEAVKEDATGAETANGFNRPQSLTHQRGSDEGYVSSGKRNLRNVWSVSSQPFSGAHFATFPPDLIEPCIKAGSRPGDTVLDPFGGAGTTGLVADRLGRNAILTELNPEYAAMAQRRIQNDAGMFALVEVVQFQEAAE
jgi:DNA modification methylase